MDILVIILIAISVLLALVSVCLIFALKKLSGACAGQDMVLLHNRLNNFSDSMERKFTESNKILHDHLLKSSDTIRAVTEKLVRLDETNNKVVDFARQLQRLEYILKNPKQRGIYGEYILESILADTLPCASFKTQYRFKDGSIVDAAIMVDNKIIPIDAKFSLSKYYQYIDTDEKELRDKLGKEILTDIKSRINETGKYVKPEEKTTGFALMFIPAEGLFQQVVSGFDQTVSSATGDIIAYAYSKSVVMVSPSNLFAYLQIILQALHELKVKNSISDILGQVRNLIKHVRLYDQYLNKLGKNIQTVITSYNAVYQQLKLICSDIKKLTPEEKLDIVPEIINRTDISGAD